MPKVAIPKSDQSFGLIYTALVYGHVYLLVLEIKQAAIAVPSGFYFEPGKGCTR